MSIKLTDLQIERAARLLTFNPKCCVVLHENMDWKNSRVCEAELKFENGKAKIINSCGEPCSFVCETARQFWDNVNLIRSVVRAINEQ